MKIRFNKVIGVIAILTTLVRIEGRASAGGGRFGNDANPKVDETMEITKDEFKLTRMSKIDSEIKDLELEKKYHRSLENSQRNDLDQKENDLQLERQFLSQVSIDMTKYKRLKETLELRLKLRSELSNIELQLRVLKLNNNDDKQKEELSKKMNSIRERELARTKEIEELVLNKPKSTLEMVSEIAQNVLAPPLTQDYSKDTQLGQQGYPNGLTSGAYPRYPIVYNNRTSASAKTYPTYYANGNSANTGIAVPGK